MQKNPTHYTSINSADVLRFENLATEQMVVIQEWKTIRALLSDTIQKYLVACTNLNVLCTRPQGLLSDRLAVEHALGSVDTELSQMMLEEERLRKARICLTETRNGSPALAPVNKLPPEILSHIFIMSKKYCLDDAKSHGVSTHVVLDVFSGVCTHWRRVALATPALWTHIDISPHADTKLRSKSAEMLLQRSRDLPVHLHVIESDQIYKSPNEAAAHRLAKFLTPYMARFSDLYLSTDNYSRKFIRQVLRLWTTQTNPSSAHALSICRPRGSMFFNISEEIEASISSKFGSKDRIESILLSLRVLHLHNAGLKWSSAAYSGLVDLQIHSSTDSVLISISEMASVLSSSPGLVTLKLGNVCLHSPEGSERPSSVSLDRLKVLGLVYMHFSSLCFLLPLISPPHCSKSLSLGVTVNEGFKLTPELEYFFESVRVTTLYARGNPSRPNLKHVLPLLALLSTLDTLGIDSYELEGESLSTSNIVDENGTSSSHALPSPFYIPKLCVVRCSVDIDGLSFLVSTYRIRYLHLEGCQALKKSNSNAEQNPNSKREIIEGYRFSLCQKFPELECIVSEVDTVQHWPCCTTLPCTFPSS